MNIIDPHVHIWKNDPEYPWPRENENPPKEDAPVEQLLARMVEHGVERTVLVQVMHYRWDNRYAGDCLKRFPEKFEGVCRVNPESPSAPDDLSRWTEDYGFQGVRLSPSGGSKRDWFTSPDLAPLWERVRSLKVPLCILTHLDRLPHLEEWIRRYEGVQVCVDHMAWPPVDRPGDLESLLRLVEYPEVYVKISGTWAVSQEPYPYHDTHETVRRVYDTFGPTRLMWGTDWPLVEKNCGYTGALDLVRSEFEFLNDEDLGWILEKTILKLWPFETSDRAVGR